MVVKDATGKEVKGQVVGRGNYWGHAFATVAFKAENVPALGYKVYAIDNSPDARLPGEGAKIDRQFPEGTESMIVEINESGVMENEFLRVEMDFPSGAIKHLIDKETGFDYVPEGKLLGVIEAYQEVHRGMSAWAIGQIAKVKPLVKGGKLTISQRGPNRVAFRSEHKYNHSRINVEIGLNAGSRMVDFKLNMRWVEIGTPETGVPMLRAAFPVNVMQRHCRRYEIPFGSQKRVQSLQEIPALKWADLSDDKIAASRSSTTPNSATRCVDDTLRLTLDPFELRPRSASRGQRSRDQVRDHRAQGRLRRQRRHPRGRAVQLADGGRQHDRPEGRAARGEELRRGPDPERVPSTIKKAEDGKVSRHPPLRDGPARRPPPRSESPTSSSRTPRPSKPTSSSARSPRTRPR